MRRLFAALAAFTLIALHLQAADPMLTFTLKAKGQPTLHIQEAPNGIVIEEYKGKVVLLNFFGKNCRWCMKEIPDLVAMQKEYGKDLQIVAIHAQQRMTPGEWFKLNKRFQFNYPVYEYMDNPDFVQYIAHRAQWDGSLPFSILLDRTGSAIKIIPGYMPKDMFEKLIDYAIGQKPEPAPVAKPR
jgi:thiol-disulfide isomerase/thioredoxin